MVRLPAIHVHILPNVTCIQVSTPKKIMSDKKKNDFAQKLASTCEPMRQCRMRGWCLLQIIAPYFSTHTQYSFDCIDRLSFWILFFILCVTSFDYVLCCFFFFIIMFSPINKLCIRNININKNLAKVERKSSSSFFFLLSSSSSKWWYYEMQRSFKIDKVFFSRFILFTSFAVTLPIFVSRFAVFTSEAHTHKKRKNNFIRTENICLAMFVILEKFNFKLSANIPQSPWSCLSTALLFLFFHFTACTSSVVKLHHFSQ